MWDPKWAEWHVFWWVDYGQCGLTGLLMLVKQLLKLLGTPWKRCSYSFFLLVQEFCAPVLERQESCFSQEDCCMIGVGFSHGSNCVSQPGSLISKLVALWRFVLALTFASQSSIASMVQRDHMEWYFWEWWSLDGDQMWLWYLMAGSWKCFFFLQLRQAKAEVVTASRIAKRFIFSSCTTSTSAVTPDPWLKNMATSSRNSRRIGFSRNPSQQLLRNQSFSRMENETEDNRLVKHHRDMNRDTSRYVPLSKIAILPTYISSLQMDYKSCVRL